MKFKLPISKRKDIEIDTDAMSVFTIHAYPGGGNVANSRGVQGIDGFVGGTKRADLA